MCAILRYCLLLMPLCVFSTTQAHAVGNQSKNLTQDPKFTLSAIYFNNVDLIDGFELFPLYEEYLGAKIRMSKLREICNGITRLYHKKGFEEAKCILPPQSMKDGVVKMQIVESIIGKVSLSGDVSEDNNLLRSYVDHIPLNQSLDMKQINYVERLIATVPGTSVSIYVKPIPESHKLELLFDIKKTYFSGEVYANNRGSKVLGPVQLGIALASYSLFGVNEYLRLHLLTTEDTEELKYAEFTSSLPVGSDGSLLLFEASHADSTPGDILKPFDIDVQVSTGRLGWTKPLLLIATDTFLVTGWLDYFKSDTQFSSSRVARDEVYKVEFALAYIVSNARHYTKTNIALSHGLAGLNTTVSNTNGLVSTGKEGFDAIMFDVFYHAVLSSNLRLSLQTQGQYAFTDLPVSEFIVFGGEVMGSAYDPAEFFGDHGLGGKSRLNYQFDNSLISSGYTQIYAQYDIVRIWNNDLHNRNSGASLATGFTVGSDAFYLDLQIAKPLTRPVLLEGNNDARFFGTLRVFF